MDKHQPPAEFISIEEACIRARRTRRYLMQLCRDGELRTERAGSEWRIEVSSLDDFFRRQAQKRTEFYEQLSQNRVVEYQNAAAPSRWRKSLALSAVVLTLVVGVGAIAMQLPVSRGGSVASVGAIDALGTFVFRVVCPLFGTCNDDSGNLAAVPKDSVASLKTNTPATPTTSMSPSASTKSRNVVVNNPVVERIVEKTVPQLVEAGVNAEYVAKQLQELDNKFTSQLNLVSAERFSGAPNATPITTQTFAQASRIDKLGSADITNSTFSGGTISDSSLSANNLSVSGSTYLATTTVTGDLSVSGSLGVQNISLSSTTVTINGIAGQTSNFLDIKNASGTTVFAVQPDGTLISNTSSTTQSVSQLLVTGNATATNMVILNAASTTNLLTQNATSTNLFAVNASTTNATSTNLYASAAHFVSGVIDSLSAAVASITNLTATNLFATNASSTNATTTNLAVTNLTSFTSPIAPYFTATSSTASSFPYASSTAITVSGTTFLNGGLLALASSTFTGDTHFSANVGIGTSTPFTKLSVAGDAYIGGNLTATGTLSISGAVTLSNPSANTLLYTNGGNQVASASVGSSLTFSGGSLSLNTGNANSFSALQQFTNATSTLFQATQKAYFGTSAQSSFDFNGALTLGTPLAKTSGGTGISSYTAGDILYADGSGNLQTLPIGGAGTVLKVQAGLPAWGTDLTGSGGGGSGTGNFFSTTTDNLLIYPTDTSKVVAIGASATSSLNSIFEVHGQSYFSSLLGIATTTPATTLSVGGSGYFTGGLGVGVLNTSAGTLQTSGNATIGGTLLLPGLSTNSLLYNNGFNQVAAASVNSSLTFSGGSLSLNTSNANTWSNLQTFSSGFIGSASSTVVGGFTVSGTATSTTLAITGVTSSLVKTNSLGQVAAAVSGTDYAPATAGSSIQLGNGAGGFSSYAGTSCTNQFVRSLNGAGVATCASVNLATDVTGTLGIANGGTGLGSIGASSTVLVSNGTSAAWQQLQFAAIGGTVQNTQLANSAVTVSAGSGLSGGGAVSLGGSTSLSLNTGNANAWSALQTFANASTSLLSVTNKAYFGGTATSTFDSAGNLSLVSNGLTVGTNQLVVSGGNVGIGTTSPATLLSVAGNGYFTGNIGLGVASPVAVLDLGATNKYVAWGSNYKFGVDSTNVVSFDQGTSFPSGYRLNTSATAGLFVNSSGNVGIGTTTPFTQFTVISASTTPQRVGQVSPTASNDVALAMQGRYAYMTIDSAGELMAIYDVSTPSSPVLISTSTLNTFAQGIAVQGQYAYLADNDTTNAFEVWNIANPKKPARVGTASLSASNWGEDIAVSGRYAYVIGANALNIFDVSNPGAPARVGSGSLNATGRNIAVRGNYAYIVDNTITTNAFEIWDISNPTAPTRVGQGTLSSSGLFGIAVQDKYAYVGNEIWDVSNPTAPTHVSTLAALSGGISVQGRYLYMSANNSTSNSYFTIWDVSNPASPSLVSSNLQNGRSFSMVAQGRYAYILNYQVASSNNFEIWDLGGAYVQNVHIGALEAGTLSLGNMLSGVNAAFTGGLAVGQSLNVSGSASFSAATSTYGTSANIFNIATASSSVPIFSALGNSNIGLGTATPLARLAVAGTTTSSTIPAAGATGNSLLYLSNSDTAYGLLFGNIASNGSAWIQAQRTDGTASTYNLLLQPNGGNVGIGTTTPNTLLTVAGSANFGVNANAALSTAVVNIGSGTALNDFSIAGGSGYGLLVEPTIAVSNNASAVYGSYLYSSTNVASGKTLTNQYGAYIPAITNIGSGAVTTAYGLYVNTPTAGSSNFAAYFGGNVGIGTTTPNNRLTVTGGNIYTEGTGGVGGVVILKGTGVGGHQYEFYSDTPSVGYLALYDRTTGSYPMVVNSSDQVGFGGQTSPGAAVDIIGGTNTSLNITNTNANPWAIQLRNAAYTSSFGAGLQGYQANTGEFNLRAGGSGGVTLGVGATSWAALSDQRLKTNITAIATSTTATSSALDMIDALRPVTFNWRDASSTAPLQLGFIAQEVRNVFPELVAVNSTTTIHAADGSDIKIPDVLTLNYDGLIAPAIAAIQELNSKVDTYIAALSDSLKSSLVAWFADAANGIGDFFANRVHTKQLCVAKSDGTDVCVNGDQLSALISGQTASAAVAVATSTTSSAVDIIVNGNNPAIVQLKTSYSDLGATASTTDTTILNFGVRTFQAGQEVTNPTIDTTVVGTSTIEYKIIDGTGTVLASAIRTVVVVDPNATSTTPVMTDTATSTAPVSDSTSTTTATSTTP